MMTINIIVFSFYTCIYLVVLMEAEDKHVSWISLYVGVLECLCV